MDEHNERRAVCMRERWKDVESDFNHDQHINVDSGKCDAYTRNVAKGLSEYFFRRKK